MNRKLCALHIKSKNIEYYENKSKNKKSDPQKTKEKMKILFGKRDEELEEIIKKEYKKKLEELQSRFKL